MLSSDIETELNFHEKFNLSDWETLTNDLFFELEQDFITKYLGVMRIIADLITKQKSDFTNLNDEIKLTLYSCKTFDMAYQQRIAKLDEETVKEKELTDSECLEMQIKRAQQIQQDIQEEKQHLEELSDLFIRYKLRLKTNLEINSEL